MLNANHTVAHHLTASLIQTIYQTITKHPQNDSSKGISTLKLAAGSQGILMKTQVRQQWRSSIYRLFLFLSTTWKSFTILRQNPTVDMELFKLPIRGYVQANWRADDSGENG